MQLNYPTDLPIVASRKDFLELFLRNQVIIVSGETGSGKTTQLPKFCLEAAPDSPLMIGCTQPRRVAATSVAERVATELKADKGLVAYKIRFHDKTTRETRIKFMTDGVLLAETRQDPMLRKYGVIIIDEAHERSLNIDFLLGYLKGLLPKRPELKLIITSATIDTQIFSKHFDNAPVMVVEGRSYPVELRYQESASAPPDHEEISTAERCVQTLRELHRHEVPEDTLIFMATEKDIRECCRLLEGELPGTLILPMFGRLAASDQKRIFQSSHLTKIVVATNVAETSITVPGIRYVIDSGLARISQYNVRARTTSLPITRISKASADQRKGRCGRVGPGICIRMYSEEDYLDREPYTLPEIKRSNLADVILQMISMDLGSPFEFPFVEPPPAAAIRDGFTALFELGALNKDKGLSPIGRLMAKLPIDPPISRILIAARDNNCVREITIIAPALAIQDPRVRPAGREASADQAHKKFAHKKSDFLSLLNIWDLFHGAQEQGLSWGRLKKFCTSHSLSFQRMREWIDLHDQLKRLLKREKGFTENDQAASYAAVHQSLCCGLLRNMGLKKEKEKKLYQGAGGKEFMVFPGSHQFHSSGKWLIGATFLETNRLYALTVANVEVEWLIEAGEHLCRRSWLSPRWQKKSGQVVATEKINLFGFVLSADKLINFGRTTKENQAEARKIFIQEALLAQEINGKYPFLTHNGALLKTWQDTEERLRKRNLLVDDNTLGLFYDRRLPPDVYDRFTLNRFLSRTKNQSLLEMGEEDILTRMPEEREYQDFPDQLTIGTHTLSLSYHLAPGEEDDGVTVHIPLEAVDTLSEASFEWLVPGLIREKVTLLLKGLPKRIRKHLIPLNNTVDLILDDCSHYQGSLYQALERGIFKMFRLQVMRSDWPQQLPPHLQMRFLLSDAQGRTVSTSRVLGQLVRRSQEIPHTKITPSKQLSRTLAPWQDKIFERWDFDGLMRQVPLFTADNKAAGSLYPSLTVEKHRAGVSLRFIADPALAARQNRIGSLYLYQIHFREQFKNLKKYCTSCTSAPSLQWLVTMFGNRAKTNEAFLNYIMRGLFHKGLDTIPERDVYEAEIQRIAQIGLYQRGREICDEIFKVLRSRREASEHIKRYAALAQKAHCYESEQYQDYQQLLEEILPSGFLESDSLDTLQGCGRHFQALMIRIERAHANPDKDRTKAQQLRPYLQRISSLPTEPSLLPRECQEAIAHYRAMVSEFRVTIFAPEISGGIQVSAKKLKLQWQQLQSLCPGV